MGIGKSHVTWAIEMLYIPCASCYGTNDFRYGRSGPMELRTRMMENTNRIRKRDIISRKDTNHCHRCTSMQIRKLQRYSFDSMYWISIKICSKKYNTFTEHRTQPINLQKVQNIQCRIRPEVPMDTIKSQWTSLSKYHLNLRPFTRRKTHQIGNRAGDFRSVLMDNLLFQEHFENVMNHQKTIARNGYFHFATRTIQMSWVSSC